MPQQKRQTTKGKSETAPDAASDLIPAEIRELLGPSPVVDIVEEPIFDRLLAAAVSELNPSGMIEWTLVYDFVVTSWEIRQLREYKTSFLRIENANHRMNQKPDRRNAKAEGLEGLKKALFTEEELKRMSVKQIAAMAVQQARENGAFIKSDIKKIDLEKISSDEDKYDRALRLSSVITKKAQTIDHLQKMTLMLERRRDTLLRDLDRRQATRRENAARRVQHDDATDVDAGVAV